MKNKYKIISILCVFAIVFSFFSVVSSFGISAANENNDVILAATQYVNNARNSATSEGLLSAVKAVNSKLTLKKEDFYIKHSVDGCTDDDKTSGYPLKIEGSDGAVSAIIYNGKTAIPFSCAFSHSTEVIHISEVAVAGTSKGFSYDKLKGNVVGYSGTADKIVFPKGYKGTLASLSDEKFPNRNNVKVIMFKNSDKTYKLSANSLNGFAGNAEDPSPEAWNYKSLKALDIFGGENFCGSGKTGIFGEKNTVAFLPALKYVSLPEALENSDFINNWCFSYLPMLENINVPYCNGQIMFGSFKYTGARELTYQIRETDFASSAKYGIPNGTVNEIDCNSAATFLQGAAYVSASVNEQLTNKTAETDIFSNPALYAEGWKNMSEGWPKLVSPSTDYFKTFTVSAFSDWTLIGNYYLKSYKLSDGKSTSYFYTVKKNPDIEKKENEIIKAACDYVDKNKNLCTFDGLVDALNSVSGDVTVKEENFYIKHSVDGCTDNDTVSGYPLTVEGSDGAVSAVLNFYSEEYNFVRAFAREDEQIDITKTAVAGSDSDFIYDSNDNVIGYTGNADKIVFPSGYKGTLEKITDSSMFPNRDNIKVIIFANGDKAVPLKEGALSGYGENSNDAYSSWMFKSLRAVEIYKDRNYLWSTNNGKTNILASNGVIRNLPNVKYLTLPYVLDNADIIAAYNVYCMPALENVNIPGKAYIQQYAFYNTSLREIEFGVPGYLTEIDKWGNAAHNDDGYGPIGGTRNVLLNSQINETIKDITFVQASAYAAANINECISSGKSSSDIINCGLDGLVGWSASTKDYFKAMNIKYASDWSKGKISDTALIDIYYGQNVARMNAERVKTLTCLSADNEFTSPFSPDVTEYSLTVPYSVTSVDFKTNLANGAVLKSVEGNSDFEVGVTKRVVLTVTTVDGDDVEYTVNVTRDREYSLSDVEKLLQDVSASYKATNSTSQSVYEAMLKKSVVTTGFTLNIDEYYLYKSIMGAKDNYGVIASGYNGYIISNVNISNGELSENILLKSTVAPDMKEYTFKKSEISTKKDFMLSADGKTLEYYTGEAKKIVIPEGITSIDMGWFDGNTANAQVIIFPNSLVECDGTGLCAKLRHLEVCAFGDEFRELPAGAFENCYMLQIVQLPQNLETIGSGAFQFTCMLEELFIPEGVVNINNKAFWQSGVRRLLIPSNVKNLLPDSICYPCNGPSDNSYLSSEYKDSEDYKIVGDFYNSRVIDNLRVRVLSPDVVYDRNFGSNATGWLGHVVTVYAPEEFKGTFEPTGSNSSYNFNMNMAFLEACAYANVYLDNMVITNKTTADDVLAMAKSSFYSLNDYEVSFAEPFKVSKSVATGSIKLSDGTNDFIISFNRPVFKETEIEHFEFKYATNDTLKHNYISETENDTVYTTRYKYETEQYLEYYDGADTNISDGNNVEVNAENNQQASGKRRLVRKKIIYPFYMQTWFIIVCVIAVLAVVAGVILLIIAKKKSAKRIMGEK